MRRVQFLCHFLHALRGGRTAYDLRRGELTIMANPDRPGEYGVQYSPRVGTNKTQNAKAVIKACGSNSAGHLIQPIVWSNEWADILQQFKSVTPNCAYKTIVEAMVQKDKSQHTREEKQHAFYLYHSSYARVTGRPH